MKRRQRIRRESDDGAGRIFRGRQCLGPVLEAAAGSGFVGMRHGAVFRRDSRGLEGHFHPFGRWSRVAAGKVKWKVAPAPRLGVAHSRPPWASTMD